MHEPTTEKQHGGEPKTPADWEQVLRARLADAELPLPLRVAPGGPLVLAEIVAADGDVVANCYGNAAWLLDTDETAALLQAALNAAPHLLSEVELLRELLAALVAEVDAADHWLRNTEAADAARAEIKASQAQPPATEKPIRPVPPPYARVGQVWRLHRKHMSLRGSTLVRVTAVNGETVETQEVDGSLRFTVSITTLLARAHLLVQAGGEEQPR